MKSILYINSGLSDVKTKKDYLLDAAKKLGLNNVQPIESLDHAPELPEYVLNVQPYWNRLRMGNKWTGAWEIDCLVNRKRMQWYWNKLDTVFLANRFNWIGEYPKNVKFLMQACDPDYYNFDIKQKYDLVQIGNMHDLAYFDDYGLKESSKVEIQDTYDIYKTRRDIFEKLKKRYNVFVHDSPSRLPVKEYLEILSRGKIQFIRSMDVMGEGEIAQRFFESLPIGPVLTNYAQDLDYLDLLPDRDYCVYRTEEEMFSKIDELLNDEPLRTDIARHGREKALKEHTFENRLFEILDFLIDNYDF